MIWAVKCLWLLFFSFILYIYFVVRIGKLIVPVACGQLLLRLFIDTVAHDSRVGVSAIEFIQANGFYLFLRVAYGS